ncbi:MAG: alpha/beta fold hydrolase [Parahaliea sp.]
MNTLLLVVLVLVGLAVLLYLAFPAWLMDAGVRLARRRGGMREQRIRVGAIEWPYLEGGDPQGTPVVLIHGFGGDKDNWTYYAPFLTEHYRLITPDLPGFGENDRSMGEDYSVTTQAARVRDFLDAIGVDRCHLGGNSMGGFIALQFALDYPERLLSLTLFNSAGVAGRDESELEQMIAVDPGGNPLAVRTPADVGRLFTLVAYKPRWLPGRFKAVLFVRFKEHEKLLDQIFQQIISARHGGMLNDRLPQLAMPVQIIWGRHDRLIDVSCALVLHENIPGSELVIFEDVGHVPMIEKPGETARHHLSFLDKY